MMMFSEVSSFCAFQSGNIWMEAFGDCKEVEEGKEEQEYIWFEQVMELIQKNTHSSMVWGTMSLLPHLQG